MKPVFQRSLALACVFLSALLLAFDPAMATPSGAGVGLDWVSTGMILTFTVAVLIVIGFFYLILRMVQRERSSASLAKNVRLTPRKAARHHDDEEFGDSYTPPPPLVRPEPVAVWSDASIDEAPDQNVGDVAGMGPGSKAKRVYQNSVRMELNDADRIEVEEVADALTQADLLTTLGMYDEAIEILIVKIGETESLPTAWLMLFDLYARTEKRQQYEALAAGFHAQFNAITPNWEDLKTEGLKRIDDYPVVLNKITHSWGLPTCREFLRSLLYDDRGGSRQGFMITAYRDILFLVEIIDTLDAMTIEEDERRKLMGKIGFNA